jgi:SHAQKYF class myb-like DNA-binding protein
MMLTESAPDGALEGDDSLMIELPDHLKLGGGNEDHEPFQLKPAMLAASHEQQQQNEQQQQQQQQGCGVGVGTCAGGGAGTILCTDIDLAFSLDGAFFTPNSADAMQARWGTMGSSSPMMDSRIARAAPKDLQRARSVCEMRSVSSSSGSPRGSYTMDLASPTAAGVLSGGGGEEGGANPWAASDNGSRCADDAGAGLAAGRWTEPEHLLFLEGLRLCGKDWRKLAEHVKTRSAVQIRTHAQKYFLKEARVGVGLIAKADAAAAPNIFTMNQPSERLLQQQAQSARLGKRKPVEIVPVRNKRSMSLPALGFSGLADESRSGSSLRSLDAADVERDTAHFVMGEEVLLPPPMALANAPRSPKSQLKAQELIQASGPTGPSLGAMLPRDNLLWPGIDVIDHEGEQPVNLQPPPPQHLQIQMQQQELDAAELFSLFSEHGAQAHDQGGQAQQLVGLF